MKYLTILLMLAGCASEPESKQIVCWERFDVVGVLKYGDVYQGKTTPNCNGWCIGKDVGARCACKETCICKRK